MTSKDTSKIKCVRCSAMILPATASRNRGLCMPCKEGRRRNQKRLDKNNISNQPRENTFVGSKNYTKRHFAGWSSATVILILYVALMILVIQPIVVEKLVLGSTNAREWFSTLHTLLLLLNGIFIVYIVSRHIAIAGKHLYIPIFWTFFTCATLLAARELLGNELYKYGLIPLDEVLEKIDLLSWEGLKTLLFIILVIPSVGFYGYLNKKKTPFISPGAGNVFAQLGSFIFGVGSAAYEYSRLKGNDILSDEMGGGCDDSEGDIDIPDSFL